MLNLNAKLIQKHYNKSSVVGRLKQLDFIYREIANRTADRLDYIKSPPPSVILDIGSGCGIDAELLSNRFPESLLIQLDFAVNILKDNQRKNRPKASWLKKIFGVPIFGLLGHHNKYNQFLCANALNLPLQSQSVDIVWSNLCLPYIDVNSLVDYFKEIYRVLRVGGYFLVTGLGVDSLQQLRDIGLQTFNFPDMHIIGDHLVKLGFTHSVTDVEYINLEYDSLEQLLDDIRIVGCGEAILSQSFMQKEIKSNASMTAPATSNVIPSGAYLSKKNYQQLKSKFNELMNSTNKFILTLEVYYAHAWKERVHSTLPEDKKIVQFYPKNK